MLDDESWKQLDDELHELRRLLDQDSPYGEVAAFVRKTIKSVEGKLIRPRWEKLWKFQGFVAPAWFPYSKHPKKDKVNRALHSVFTEMVRFVTEKVPYLQQECFGQLHKSLCVYLSLRGYEVGHLSRHPLTETAQMVLDIIREQPEGNGIMGKAIIKELSLRHRHIEQSSLTSHTIPKLKKWYGVANRRGVGYFIQST